MTSISRVPRRLLSVATLLTAVALTACGGGLGDKDEADAGTTPSAPSTSASTSAPTPSAPASTPDANAGLVYVAVGASETVGIGADDPQRDAWPVVLHRTALTKARLVNLGCPARPPARQ